MYIAAVAYLILVNLIAFFAYGHDKVKARSGQWRTRESTLLGLAAIGGSFGALMGMRVFRHKTRHAKFFLGVPALLIAQLALAAWLLG